MGPIYCDGTMDGSPEGWQFGEPVDYVEQWDGTLGWNPFKAIVGVVKKVAKPLVGVVTSIIPGGGVVRTALNVGGSLLKGKPKALAIPAPVRPVLRFDPTIIARLRDTALKSKKAAELRRAGDVEGARRVQREPFTPPAPGTSPFIPPVPITPSAPTNGAPAPGDGLGRFLVPALIVGGLIFLSRRGTT